jgi:hypothetical protein
LGDPATAKCLAETHTLGGGLSLQSDVIIAVDTSSTMADEVTSLQASINLLNHRFFATITKLVVLAGYPGAAGTPGLCVPYPLGTGLCPPDGSDSQEWSLFHHPTLTVRGEDALNVLIDAYPEYSPQLFPKARRTVIVVTDGNATTPPMNDASLFIERFNALSPGAAGWQMSAIYAFSQCANARAPGTVYRDIVERTGGVHADLCSETMSAALERIYAGISQKLLDRCEVFLPTSQGSAPFPFASLNVVLRHDSGVQRLVNYVGSGDRCDSAGGGWYYEDTSWPHSLRMCPATCSQLGPDLEIDMHLGCPAATPPSPGSNG